MRSVGYLLVSLAFLSLSLPASAGDWSVLWTDTDGDCQTTRTEVLIRENQGLIQWADPRACEVADGRWQSWGLDVELDLSRTRVVALVPPENAMRSGAEDWPKEKKRRFMNDMENLIVLDPVSARQRAGHGPDRWIPLKKYWCEYASRWERIKQRYGLSMTEDERGAIAHMKKSCDNAGRQDTGTEK